MLFSSKVIGEVEDWTEADFIAPSVVCIFHLILFCSLFKIGHTDRRSTNLKTTLAQRRHLQAEGFSYYMTSKSKIMWKRNDGIGAEASKSASLNIRGGGSGGAVKVTNPYIFISQIDVVVFA